VDILIGFQDTYTERILYHGRLYMQRGYCTKNACTARILYLGHLLREYSVPRTPAQRGYCTKDTCTERILHPGDLLKEDTAPRTPAQRGY
jgi:hypothetical protein